MLSSKKNGTTVTEKDSSNVSEQDEMAQMAEIISEAVLERDLEHLESFELYAHQLRTHLHINPDMFKRRFTEGYRVLLEELEKNPTH